MPVRFWATPRLTHQSQSPRNSLPARRFCKGPVLKVLKPSWLRSCQGAMSRCTTSLLKKSFRSECCGLDASLLRHKCHGCDDLPAVMPQVYVRQRHLLPSRRRLATQAVWATVRVGDIQSYLPRPMFHELPSRERRVRSIRLPVRAVPGIQGVC